MIKRNLFSQAEVYSITGDSIYELFNKQICQTMCICYFRSYLIRPDHINAQKADYKWHQINDTY